MPERDFAAELKQTQSEGKVLAAQRDKLMRDAGSEEHKVQEAVAKLRELGVNFPETLSVEELQTLRASTQAQLEQQLVAIQKQIADGNTLVAEYEALAQG